MMARASEASASCTVMRTSLRPSTESGKIDSERSDETTEITPCASRRLRTTRASMLDGVRKTTTSSGNGLSDLVNLQQNERHVIVLRRVAHERGDFPEH